jgi:hypothetical protein
MRPYPHGETEFLRLLGYPCRWIVKLLELGNRMELSND